MEEKSKTGVILLNVGTPDAPRAREVRRYLGEFLSDPRVLDINPVGRWLLLNLIILPFRPAKSAEAYKKIWTSEGSPLLVESLRFRDALRQELGPDFVVSLGMRYGRPSIDDAWQEMTSDAPRRVVVFPLFPQSAASTTGTATAACFAANSRAWNPLPLSVCEPFHSHPGFLAAWAAVASDALEDFAPDYLLFSFHGLPVRHVAKDAPGHCPCDATQPCSSLGANNRFCYRAQCYATARGIASQLPYQEHQWGVAFQSRLGRDPWIQPYTDERLPALAKQGIRRLAVAAPAFVADGLETLEEIGLRAKEQWMELGGEAFHLIPCLNSHPMWVEAAAELVRHC